MHVRTVLGVWFSVMLTATPVFAGPVSMLQFDEQNASKFGFTHDDVQRFLAYGNQFPACSEVARAFPNMSAIPGNVPMLVHILHQHAACRTSLKEQHAPLGVFRVEDSLRGLTCTAIAMIAPDSDASNDPDCSLPNSVPVPSQ
jgi:hypothetical protein